MEQMEVNSFGKPDEVKNYEKGRVELIKIGGTMIGKDILEPGWKWSKHVKPLANTKSCKAKHFLYHVSGTLHVVMDDGTEKDIKAGEVSSIPAGHDAWVVGNEPVIVIDFQGMLDYVKQSAKK